MTEHNGHDNTDPLLQNMGFLSHGVPLAEELELVVRPARIFLALCYSLKLLTTQSFLSSVFHSGQTCLNMEALNFSVSPLYLSIAFNPVNPLYL